MKSFPLRFQAWSIYTWLCRRICARRKIGKSPLSILIYFVGCFFCVVTGHQIDILLVSPPWLLCRNGVFMLPFQADFADLIGASSHHFHHFAAFLSEFCAQWSRSLPIRLPRCSASTYYLSFFVVVALHQILTFPFLYTATDHGFASTSYRFYWPSKRLNALLHWCR